MFVQQLYKMGILSGIKTSIFGASIDFQEKIKEGAIVVDVRTPAEFKSGHFMNSKNLPLQNLGEKWEELKGKEIILVCRSGARAAQAKSILTNHGITAYNAGSWQNLNQ